MQLLLPQLVLSICHVYCWHNAQYHKMGVPFVKFNSSRCLGWLLRSNCRWVYGQSAVALFKSKNWVAAQPGSTAPPCCSRSEATQHAHGYRPLNCGLIVYRHRLGLHTSHRDCQIKPRPIHLNWPHMKGCTLIEPRHEFVHTYQLPSMCRKVHQCQGLT